MVKYFCDRCNEECSSTGVIHVSTPQFNRMPLLCASCQTSLENMIDGFLKNKGQEKEA
jgi:uncharacterized CHY-type Zn-finger protein